ncbi:MAG: GNAT family N-acetyltransferase, partial [Chloroflexi bacterium]|nr:GNAT family N-acetyltransferase [Chloroflexota bacterium]
MIERTFEKNDLPSLLELLRSNFNGWHSAQYWTWQYEENPNGSPITWVAEDNGKIVGCYNLIPTKIRIGQTSTKGAQAVDAAVDKSYRHAGIFKKLATNAIAQAKQEEIALVYAFPNEYSYRGQVRIGYRPMSIIPKMYKVFHLDSVFEEYGFKGLLAQKAANLMEVIQRITETMTNPELINSYYVKKIKDFDSRFDIFWSKIKESNNKILVERDATYLRWRYSRHPEKRYTTYICEKNGEIAGYIILSLEKNVSFEGKGAGKLSVGNIVDLLTLPDATDAAYLLISAACAYFERENVNVASCWMFSRFSYHTILKKFGFSDYFELFRRAILRPSYVRN